MYACMTVIITHEDLRKDVSTTLHMHTAMTINLTASWTMKHITVMAIALLSQKGLLFDADSGEDIRINVIHFMSLCGH